MLDDKIYCTLVHHFTTFTCKMTYSIYGDVIIGKDLGEFCYWYSSVYQERHQPVSSVNQSSVSLWCDQREATSSSDHGMVKGGVSLGVICFKSCLVVFLFCVLYMDERYVFGGQ